jgi:hypothetical protein
MAQEGFHYCGSHLGRVAFVVKENESPDRLQIRFLRTGTVVFDSHWLAESARDRAAGVLEGHGPEQHALNLQAILGRVESEEWGIARRTDGLWGKS